MRQIWTGSISFGLVNIPVQLYSGTNPHEGLDLDMLHKKDKSPIRYARVCRKDGTEVPWEDIIKGYEYRKGDYVTLTQNELDKFDARKSQTIEVIQFTPQEEIDIRYFEKPYYLEPATGGEKAYALLREALQKTGKIGVASFVIHQRQHIGALKPIGNAIILNQMRFASDLREATSLKFPPSKNLSEKELEVAVKLINQETKPFAPEDFKDTYTDEVEELIKSKVKGEKPTTKGEKGAATPTKDLINALKASLKS